MSLTGEKMYIGAGMWAVPMPENKCELRDANDEAIGGLGKWDCVFKADEGVALAIRRGRAHYIRSTGQVFHECDWMHAGYFSEGWAVGGDRTGKNGEQNRNTQLYYFDLNGKIRLRLDEQWREARGFHEGLAAVARSNDPYRPSWGYINKCGEVQIEPKWNRVFDFSDGLAVVVRSNRFAVIDKHGCELISGLEEYPSEEKLRALREGGVSR